MMIIKKKKKYNISRCLSTTPHAIGGQYTICTYYSMIILKPAILCIMVVVRYKYNLISPAHCDEADDQEEEELGS